ncbi:serine/threonine-protein kinase [Nocardia inohanensis]|uniref:serine/threonine-protein kinase n=1 Tax=Nocardia inohanensis TaxID=209246 RepID=UPI00082DADC4|nr:serine/threonine-protein kinase [Nocardia inohanensis]
MNIGPGTVLGGYRIERALGSGGMGTVYLAQHPALPRYDALKVLWPHHASDAEFRARFEREARLAATLDHPNIVTVHNKGEDEGCLWIALQYVPGTDAATAVERDPASMTARRALRIVSEIGKGLDYAHRSGMLHRDIKPANFLLAPQDHGEERVLLADFGIAKQSDGNTELTRTGTFLATIAYASPEQLSGGQVDARSDIYSLACSFYRLVAGQTPFPGTQPLEVMMGHVNQPPPRLTALRADLPAAVDAVLSRALAKDPAERYRSCEEFTEAVEAALASGYPRSAPTVRNDSPVSQFAGLAGGRAAAERAAQRAEEAEAAARAQRAADEAAKVAQRRAVAERGENAHGSVSSLARLAQERAALRERQQPLLTPLEKPLFASHRIPAMPREEPSAFVHGTEQSSSRRRLAIGIGVGVLAVTIVLLYLVGRSGGGDAQPDWSGWQSSPASLTTTISSAVAQAAPAGMQNPCDLLGDRGNPASAFGLGSVELPSSTADQRRCDWRELQQGSASGAITLSTAPAPVEAGSQSMRVANAVTAQRVRTSADTGRSYATCAVVWPTAGGHVRIEMSNHFAPTVTLDDLCARAEELADAVYPKIRS